MTNAKIEHKVHTARKMKMEKYGSKKEDPKNGRMTRRPIN
jgi:hypothetical protein